MKRTCFFRPQHRDETQCNSGPVPARQVRTCASMSGLLDAAQERGLPCLLELGHVALAPDLKRTPASHPPAPSMSASQLSWRVRLPSQSPSSFMCSRSGSARSASSAARNEARVRRSWPANAIIAKGCVRNWSGWIPKALPFGFLQRLRNSFAATHVSKWARRVRLISLWFPSLYRRLP